MTMSAIATLATRTPPRGTMRIPSPPGLRSSGTRALRKPSAPPQEELDLRSLIDSSSSGKKIARAEAIEWIEALEETMKSNVGLEIEEIEGRWELAFATSPSTASPIQRTAFGSSGTRVYQDIALSSDPPTVSNIISLGDGFLSLTIEAEAGLTGERIDFRFTRGFFSLRFLPFSIPYPVPFRLLGDKAKGWLDITYLSHRTMQRRSIVTEPLRISRGNKGTIFVLTRKMEPKEVLLDAIANNDEDTVREAIDLLTSVSSSSPAQVVDARAVANGRWRQIYSIQASDANWLQKAASSNNNKSSDSNIQVIDLANNRLMNIAEFGGSSDNSSGISATAKCECDDSTEQPQRVNIEIEKVELRLGGLVVPLPLGVGSKGYLDILYLDDEEGIRISKGNKGSIFIHVREDEET